jgi:Peptidase family M23
MKRVVALLPVLIAFQAGAPPALAWTWPADGPVLRPFVLGDDPYAAAQHRGVDIAAPLGELVRAPASGVVSFAGTVPGGGRTVTIETADGYSVTLVHLGSVAVERHQTLVEGAGVGSAGPSGQAEHPEPYVHLGVRVTADPNGYVDPLGLLPSREAPPPTPPVPPVEQVPEAPPAPPPLPEAPGAPVPVPQTPVPAPATSGPPAASVSTPTAVLSAEGPSVRADRPGEPSESVGRRAQAVPARAVSRMERTLLRAFEIPADVASHGPRERRPASAAPATGARGRGDAGLMLGAALTALVCAGLGGLALVRRRADLGRAGGADAAPAVFRDRTGRAAEHTAVARTAEEDGLVADGDLERVALGEPEPLPDLDWDDDPAELVQVPDDPRCRLPATAPRRRFHQVVPQPPRHRRRPARPAARPIQ